MDIFSNPGERVCVWRSIRFRFRKADVIRCIPPVVGLKSGCVFLGEGLGGCGPRDGRDSEG
jgi:hypothetical protein